MVHALQGPGTEVTRYIAAAFGDVLQPDGAVDRVRLGRIVFADPDALRRLEAIVHPAVRHAVRDRLDALQGPGGVVVVDAVKLLQSDLISLVETVWVVCCAPEIQRHRLTETRRLSAVEAAERMRAQPSFDHPKVGAVIENSGSRADLQRLVAEQWERFMAGPP